MVVSSSPLAAQYQPDIKVLPFEFTPQVGYRSVMNFATEPTVEGTTAKVVLESSPSKALAFGFRLNDEDVVEIRWVRQDTQVRVTGPVVPPFKQRVTLDQFHLDCSHEYIVREWPEWARPYIMASVGATHISSTTNLASATRFSFGLGAGIKIFPSPRFGFKVQAEWLPLWITQKATAVCSGGCLVRFSGQLASQGEVTAGPVFRF